MYTYQIGIFSILVLSILMHLGVVQVRLLLAGVFRPLLLSLLGLKVDVVSVSVLVLQEDVARCFTHEVWT